MGRPRTIEKDDMIKLIDQFFSEECDYNPKELKIPKLATYIQAHGYPQYAVTSLRRDEMACKHIESLKTNSEEERMNLLVSYSTLDVDQFIAAHPSTKKLRSALLTRDNYYRKVAESAVYFNNQYKDMLARQEALQQCVDSLQQQLKNQQEQTQSLADQNTSLSSERNAMRSFIEKYIEPSIANLLLDQDGLMKNPETFVSRETLEKLLLKASDTLSEEKADKLTGDIWEADSHPADSDSKVIKGIFEQFND